MIRTRRSSSTSLSDIPIYAKGGGEFLWGEDRALVLAGRGSGFYKGDVSHADTLRVSSVTAPLNTKIYRVCLLINLLINMRRGRRLCRLRPRRRKVACLRRGASARPSRGAAGNGRRPSRHARGASAMPSPKCRLQSARAEPEKLTKTTTSP